MKRTIRNLLERVGEAGQPSRAGFTLIELLIAVGALAFIAVGVAAIFEATGRTVQAGRRVSAMASYANLIERRMRDDFAAMTRDGFLIIRNEYAVGTGNVHGGVYPDVLAQGVANPDAVPLDENDQHPRLRRTDEIMFFAKGQFVSMRELLDGRYVAKADAAAIYYGHGERALVPANYNPPQTDPYYAPGVNATNSDQYARLASRTRGAGVRSGRQTRTSSPRSGSSSGTRRSCARCRRPRCRCSFPGRSACRSSR